MSGDIQTLNNLTPRALATPSILAHSAIPLIGLSSGTMNGAGAISAITALPTTYASAYCYFPANAVATTIAAGWYYCTFSGTQAGTAYLNTLTTWPPVIPTSLTPCTTASSFTGDTGEELIPAITLPANAMGLNGAWQVSAILSQTNNANTKTYRVRWSTSGGTIIFAQAPASVISSSFSGRISNRGVANAQVVWQIPNSAPDSFNVSWPAIDSSQSTTIVPSIQRGTATDNAIWEYMGFELYSDGT